MEKTVSSYKNYFTGKSFDDAETKARRNKENIMSKNTGIRIETVKEINDNGEKGYRITKIEALPKEKLSDMYLKSGPVVFTLAYYETPRLVFRTDNKEHYINGWDYIITNRFYATEVMEEIQSHIREAGQHLADINAYLRKERESWNGSVDFVDGVEQEKDILNKQSFDKPIELAEKIAELWEEGRLLYRNKKGHIKPLKPLT